MISTCEPSNQSFDLVLASGSPRRRFLLESAGCSVVCRPQDVNEAWPGGPATEAVVALAFRKLRSCVEPEMLVVAADTVVVLDDTPLGKPQNHAQAVATLSALSGKEHRVCTGVALRKRAVERSLVVVTKVRFRELSLEEIERYIALGESFDKAGAYGIQGSGAGLVDSVYGSYTNVVGLPLVETLDAIGKF